MEEKNNSIYQTSQFAVLSISYEKADAETRGRFSFFDTQIKDFVKSIHDDELGDVFVVSTCNRTEIYTTSDKHLNVAEKFCSIIGVDYQDFMKYVQVFTKTEALNHLFNVAGGLESQILGDFEIIGQIKNAYARFKKEKKTSNAYMERAINTAVQISKRIKNETGISTGAASVSYAAVHYILNKFPNISEKNILLLGVGEIGQNTVENLMKHAYKPCIKVANRTKEKAEKIAEKYQIPHINFKELDKELALTDILIVATGADRPIINKKHLSTDKEVLVIDLSIPNNVDKKVEDLENVTLIDVDELSKQISDTMEQRKKEIPTAKKIIDEMLSVFLDWEKNREMAPKIHKFKAALKKIEDNEMHNIHKKFRYVDIEDMELSEKLIQKITNRFAKYIIEHPDRAEEVSDLMHEILVEQPNIEFNEKH